MTSDWNFVREHFPMTPAGFAVSAGRKKHKQGRALRFDDRPVNALAFDAQSKRLAVSGGQMIPGPVEIRVFDLETGDRLSTCTYHRLGVFELAFSSDGLLASVSHDYSVVLWNLEERDAVFLAGGPDAGISRQCALFQGTTLIVGDGMTWRDACASLRTFDLSTGRTDEWLTFPHGTGIAHLCATPDHERYVMLIEEDMRSSMPPHEVRTLDSTGEEVARWSFDHYVYDFESVLDGVVIIGERDDDTHAWALSHDGEVQHERRLGSEIGACVTRSPKGEQVALGYESDVSICGFDLVEQSKFTIRDRVMNLAWSPNGRWLAVGTRKRTVRLFEAATGEEYLTGEHTSLWSQLFGK